MQGMEKVLQEFGKVIGIPDLQFDENGYCCLNFDDIVVNIELDKKSGQVFLNSPLGKIPEKAGLDFSDMLLEANYFFQNTGGATLAMSRKANLVQLIFTVPATGLDLIQFEKFMEDFVAIAEKWINRVKEYSLSEAEPDEIPLQHPGMRV